MREAPTSPPISGTHSTRACGSSPAAFESFFRSQGVADALSASESSVAYSCRGRPGRARCNTIHVVYSKLQNTKQRFSCTLGQIVVVVYCCRSTVEIE